MSFSLVYKILGAIVGLFFLTFSNYLFLMDNLFFPKYIPNSQSINGSIIETLSGCDSISS